MGKSTTFLNGPCSIGNCHSHYQGELTSLGNRTVMGRHGTIRNFSPWKNSLGFAHQQWWLSFLGDFMISVSPIWTNILVGASEHVFSIFWENSPNWRSHIFRRGWLKPPTSIGFPHAKRNKWRFQGENHLQCGAPQWWECWFINSMNTIVISIYKLFAYHKPYSYWSYVHQLSYRLGASHCINDGFQTMFDYRRVTHLWMNQ